MKNCQYFLRFSGFFPFLPIGKSREPERSPASMENNREEVGIKIVLNFSCVTSSEWLIYRRHCCLQ